MSAYGLLVFTAIYALAVATPGPGVAAVIARALGRGGQGAPAFIAGFVVGDLIWFACAALGLAVLAQRAYGLFVAVRYAGALYLLYLAWRLWSSAPRALAGGAAGRPEAPLQVFAGSLALTLGNPKTMVFFLAVLPTVVDLRHLSFAGACGVASVILCVLPLVLGGYTVFATRARRRLSHPRAVRWLQRGTGALMAGAALAVAAR
ncbi:MAG: LysE family translocator [Gammaproteobacteria bacterium]|nr:LysE family translocator [Gammaproteobacteria bacterium]MBV9696774.1 LysE family translocator [Gammaproteobacteria bacterium]